MLSHVDCGTVHVATYGDIPARAHGRTFGSRVAPNTDGPVRMGAVLWWRKKGSEFVHVQTAPAIVFFMFDTW
jgi:hypothetical protein